MFSRDSRAQSSDHRWGGLVSDTFALETSTGIRAWSAEDGGRIRARNPATGGWQFQVTPTEVQDTLHRTFFLAGGEVGWAVGNGGWLLKTSNGGANWNIWARFPAQYTNFTGPWEELYDVHFLDENHGWLVGTHSVWLTTNGGQGTGNWTKIDLIRFDGNIHNLGAAHEEMYAIDIIVRPDQSRLGLIVGQPGIVFRSTDANSATWQQVWDIVSLCPPPPIACGNGVLQGDECQICPSAVQHEVPWFEAWDVEISNHSTQNLALLVGGIGGATGMVFATTDNGTTWVKEYHECKCTGTGCQNCTNLPAYNDDPSDPNDLNRHRAFATLYGVDIYDNDNTAIASGYNGQHIVRNPATGVGIWEDRSVFAVGVPTTPNSVIFPLIGAEAVTSTTTGTKFAFVCGEGGHLRQSMDGGHNWTDKAIGEPNRISGIFFESSSVGWHVGQFFRINRTANSGLSWLPVAPQPVQGAGSLRAITFDGMSNGVTVGDPFTPGGASTSQPKILFTDSQNYPNWLENASITGDPASIEDRGLRDVTPSGGSHYWAAGERGLILRSTNGGQLWRLIMPEDGSTLRNFEFEGVAFIDQTTGLFAGRRVFPNGIVGGAIYQYQNVAGVVTWSQVPVTMPNGEALVGFWDVEIVGGVFWAVGEKRLPSGNVVGVVVTGPVVEGQVPGLGEDIGPVGGFQECLTGDDLDNVAVLNEVEIAPGTGELWVGGECGRLWKRSTTGAWSNVKSQTDAHVVGMSFDPTGQTGMGYIGGFRASQTQQCIVRVQ